MMVQASGHVMSVKKQDCTSLQLLHLAALLPGFATCDAPKCVKCTLSTKL